MLLEGLKYHIFPRTETYDGEFDFIDLGIF